MQNNIFWNSAKITGKHENAIIEKCPPPTNRRKRAFLMIEILFYCN